MTIMQVFLAQCHGRRHRVQGFHPRLRSTSHEIAEFLRYLLSTPYLPLHCSYRQSPSHLSRTSSPLTCSPRALGRAPNRWSQAPRSLSQASRHGTAQHLTSPATRFAKAPRSCSGHATNGSLCRPYKQARIVRPQQQHQHRRIVSLLPGRRSPPVLDVTAVAQTQGSSLTGRDQRLAAVSTTPNPGFCSPWKGLDGRPGPSNQDSCFSVSCVTWPSILQRHSSATQLLQSEPW